MRIRFSVKTWCAYSPQMNAVNLLDAQTAVDVRFLPAMKRRRLSDLSRLSLRLAHNTAPHFKGRCVFGSQHGELITTQRLLHSIVDAEVMSPAGFSASVHNTAVGLHSINCQNTAPCTSIAAGRDSLAMCFIEAYSMLEQEHLLGSNPLADVLIVFADDKMPEALDEFVSISQLHGIAVRLGKDIPETGMPVVSLEQIDKRDRVDRDPVSPLISGLLGESSSCCTMGELGDWSWQFDVE